MVDNDDRPRIICKDELLTGRYITVRQEIVRSPVLSSGAKVLYSEICSYFWDKSDMRAWPGQGHLAEMLSCHRNTISSQMKELEAVKVISRKSKGIGQPSDIFLHTPDPMLLQVTKGDKGGWIPVVSTHAQKTDIPRAQSTVHGDAQPTVHVVAQSTVHGEAKSEASEPDVVEAPAIEVLGEEEAVNVINREEEAAAPNSNLSIPPEQSPPVIPTISRNAIPEDLIPTWNSTLTEESVVIDGQRYLIIDDDENTIRGTETLEIDDALQNPEMVEVEGGNSDVNVNREKMAKLLETVGSDTEPIIEHAKNGVAAARMSRGEMRAELEKMDRRADVSPDVAIDSSDA